MGITGYGTYIPYWKLSRDAIATSLGLPAGAGARSVASFDEDSTSMAVEAARAALRNTDRDRPYELWFATTSPAYADKTNATAIHAALDLATESAAYDVVGSVRCGMAALRAATDASAAGRAAVAVLSDVRFGLSGSADERCGGDAAAAFVYDPDAPTIATQLSWASVSREFLDRWRVPGEVASHTWEERFGEVAYLPLAEEAFSRALGTTGLLPSDIDHLVIAGTHKRACAKVVDRLKVEWSSVRSDLRDTIGAPGAAQPGVLLASALDLAGPGEIVCLLNLADGADCLLLRTTSDLAAARPAASVTQLAEAGRGELSYQRFLAWRGSVQTEPPRRPELDRPAGPPSLRNLAWKFGFTASRCTTCGTRHLPPAQVCLSCRASGSMEPERLADVQGRVASYTVDRLAFSPAPPLVAAVVDFDAGGRLPCELTDVEPSEVAMGQRLEMTFRRAYSTSDGVHNYVWKARPVRTAQSPTEKE